MKSLFTDLYLDRLIDNGKETIGWLYCFTEFATLSLNTLELPWKHNRPNISCIPAGTYPWKKYESPTKGLVILLRNVPGRTKIEIHVANYVRELLGCIAVGIGKGDIDHDGLIDMTSSRDALNLLLASVADSGFIHISDKHLKKV